MLCTPRFRGCPPWRWPPSEWPFTLLWFNDELGFRQFTGSIVLSDARFCDNGNPMYCDRMACNGGNLGALAAQGGGKTGGMNQGNAPVGGPEESAPGTPPAVCNRRAWRDNSFTPANKSCDGCCVRFFRGSNLTLRSKYFCQIWYPHSLILYSFNLLYYCMIYLYRIWKTLYFSSNQILSRHYNSLLVILYKSIKLLELQNFLEKF